MNKNIQNAVLVITSLLFIAGISEIAMVFYYQSKQGKSEPVCLQADEKLIYRLKPNSDLCNTNAKGYVDFNYPQKKTGKRIVIIGDSVASGLGAPPGKSFAKLFEKELNDVLQSKYEVIVLAVPGYSTSQEIILLKDEAFQYDPDLIVVAYHLNDPAHPLFHNAGGQVGLYFRRPTSLALFYFKRLMFRAQGTVKGVMAGCPTQPWSLFLHCVYWSEVQESFREIMTISREKSTPVVFAFLPLLLDPAEGKDLPELYDRLADLAGENGTQSVDLMQPFEGYKMESVRMLDDPWHPNEKGHQILAETLFNYFKDNNLLTSGTGTK